MLTKDRRDAIYKIIEQKKSVFVKDLCEKFGVTNETIRKDLMALEKEGKILRAYGGAYIIDGARNEIHADLREMLYPEAKKSIGRVCAAMVNAGDTIFLDESTTCQAIARELKEISELTVLTNSSKVFEVMHAWENVRLMFAGGEFDRKNQCFVGETAIEVLQSYYVDKCFVSCRGVDKEIGITDGNEKNGHIRRCAMEHAEKRILAVDQTKLDLKKFYKICNFSMVDVMVVDSFQSLKQQEEWQSFLEQTNTQLKIAGV